MLSGFGPRALVAGLVLGSAVFSGCATKTTNTTSSLRKPGLFSPVKERQAINAVDAGDEDLALADLRKAVASHPDDVEIRLRLAQAYSAHGFHDVALEHYRLAAERFPASEKVAVRLARSLRAVDQGAAALQGLQAFVQAHPQQIAEPYEWLGILHDDQGQWKESEAAYRTALLYSPANAELHNNLGYAILMQARNNDAATEFHAALRLKKDLAIARNNLGIALVETPSEAILNWQAVSGPAAAHNNMGALLFERGDFAGARKELETSLGYDHQNAQAIFNLTLVAQQDGKPVVLPQEAAVAAKVSAPKKEQSVFARLLHPRRHAEAAADVTAQTAGQTGSADAAVKLPSGSGGGN